MKIFFSLLLICCGTLSCTHIDEYCGNLILFDRNESLDKFDLGNVTDSTFQIIPLETTKNNLIANIDKIEIRNNHIYIKDNLAKSIYIFDMEGKYSGKINAVGQGQGEYVIPSYMTVTDTSIIVIDSPTEKQIEYSLLSLQPVAEKRIFDKIWCTDDIFTLSGAIYYVNNWSTANLGRFRLFAAKGNDYNAYLPFKKAPFGIGIHGPVYSINGNQAFVIFAHDDVIYKVANDSVKREYKVQFKNDKIEYHSKNPESIFDNPPGRVIGIDAIHEFDKYLFIDISYTVSTDIPIGKGNYDTYTCLYNKLDGTKIIYPKSSVFNSNFDNEQIYIRKVIDNKIIDWQGADMLLMQAKYLYAEKIFKNKTYESRLKNVIANLEEDDNPVLFIYQIK